MAPSPISSQVQAFLRNHIASLEELEVLLLLHQDPGRAWTVAEVNLKIRSSEASIIERLRLLASLRLVCATDGPAAYRYAPATPELDATVAALALAYRDYRTAIIQLIYQRPSDPILNFAKAFEIKRKT